MISFPLYGLRHLAIRVHLVGGVAWALGDAHVHGQRQLASGARMFTTRFWERLAGMADF